MTKYRIGEVIGICDILDKSIDRIQKRIDEVIEKCRDEKICSELNDINSTLDGLGVDVDTAQAKLKELI